MIHAFRSTGLAPLSGGREVEKREYPFVEGRSGYAFFGAQSFHAKGFSWLGIGRLLDGFAPSSTHYRADTIYPLLHLPVLYIAL